MIALPAARVTALWPELLRRLGDRHQAFVAQAGACSASHGLDEDPCAAARYLNLCCAFGPGFEKRPEHEWALAVLADRRLAPWARLHQLQVRALQVLRGRDSDAAALARADDALLDMLDELRRQDDGDAEPLPRQACDLEAVELRLLDTDGRRAYRKLDGHWQLVALEPPAPLRVGQGQAMPARVNLTTGVRGEAPGVRLQLRQIAHGHCPDGRHPALRWIDAAGLASWRGSDARAASWTVTAATPAEPALGLALAEETGAAVALLQLPSCGLRDDGVPWGPQTLQVWAYPCTAWSFELERDGAVALHRLAAGDAAGTEIRGTRQGAAVDTAGASPTRCRIERDGQPVDASRWVDGFDRGLQEALAAGLQRLFEAWSSVVQRATAQARPGLFIGRQRLTWGWREGAGGLADDAVLHVDGEIDLGVDLELQLDGEFDLAGARTRLQLHADGRARLQRALRRDRATPALGEAALGATLRFALPWQVRADPLARADGIVCAQAGPCTGALIGDLGLRPRLSGGSGWQWYLRLASEAVMLPALVHDPLLGRSEHRVALLPAVPMVDWSLG